MACGSRPPACCKGQLGAGHLKDVYHNLAGELAILIGCIQFIAAVYICNKIGTLVGQSFCALNRYEIIHVLKIYEIRKCGFVYYAHWITKS